MRQKLFVKPKDKTWTQMCIDIDNEFYTEGADMDKLYSYMWLIAYMLTCKAKYFTKTDDMEDFATMLSYSVYSRMADKNKVPIKSVLNYTKGIMSFRRMAYEAQKHQEVINPEFDAKWDPIEFSKVQKDSLEKANHAIVEGYVIDELKLIPNLIKKNIPYVYRGNKVIQYNLYISSLLSLLSKFTLPRAIKEKYDDDIKDQPKFNTTRFYQKHLDDTIILWHLSKTYEPVIQIILNKVKNSLVKEISELSLAGNISEQEFNSMLVANFETGAVKDETSY